jgi:hypothetical protein
VHALSVLSHTFVPLAHASFFGPVHCTQVPASQTCKGVPPFWLPLLSMSEQSSSESQGTHTLFWHSDAPAVEQSPLSTHWTQVLMAAGPPPAASLQMEVAGVSVQSAFSVHATQPKSGLHAGALSGASANRPQSASTLHTEQVPFPQRDSCTPRSAHSAWVMHSEQVPPLLLGLQKGGKPLPPPVQSSLPMQATHV